VIEITFIVVPLSHTFVFGLVGSHTLILSFLRLHFLTIFLFPELLAGSFVLFPFCLSLHVTDDNSLHFRTRISILGRKPRSCILRLYLLSEGRLCVTEIKLVCVGRGVHHELLVLVVVGLGHNVGYNVGVFREQSFVVNFLPFELFPELRVAVLGLRQRAHSWESEVLEMQIPNKIDFPI
jgi:hypothetical protein